MQKVKAYIFFHLSLFGASIAVSIFLGFYFMVRSGEFSTTAVGSAYLFTPLFIQYFNYEVRNRGLYYFYYNMGINKLQLWVSTLIFNVIIAGLITFFSWLGYTLIV